MKNWRDPITKGFNCNSGDDRYGSQNQILFTVQAYYLGLITQLEAINILLLYEKEHGLFCRYPGLDDLCAQDDHIAAASLSRHFAISIYGYGQEHGWVFGDRKLWRFPLFIPMVKAGAGMKLNAWDHLKAASAYLWNGWGPIKINGSLTMGDPHGETSGRLLLWLSSKALGDTWYIRAWRNRMLHIYADGLSEMLKIYFTEEGHPFRDTLVDL